MAESDAIKILIFGVWTFYGAAHGVYDGAMYALANWNILPIVKKNIRVHPHVIATCMRLLCATPAAICVGGLDIIRVSICLFSLMLMFSLWHNGFYFVTRRMIDVPYYHFFSRSASSTGWAITLFGNRYQPFEFGPKRRIVLFIIGVYLLYIV